MAFGDKIFKRDSISFYMQFRISDESKSLMDALTTSKYTMAEIARIAGVSEPTAAKYIKRRRYYMTPMNTPESIQLKKSIDAIDSSGYRSAKNAGFTSRKR